VGSLLEVVSQQMKWVFNRFEVLAGWELALFAEKWLLTIVSRVSKAEEKVYQFLKGLKKGGHFLNR